MDTNTLRNKSEYEILLENRKEEFDADQFSLGCQINSTDIFLYNIKKLTLKDELFRREFFGSLINHFRKPGVNFIYLLIRDKSELSFYLGVIKDKFLISGNIDISEWVKNSLNPIIQNKFKESEIEFLDKERTENILNLLKDYNKFGMINGVPSFDEDKLIDITSQDRFCFGILIKPIANKEFQIIEDRLKKLYEDIVIQIEKEDIGVINNTKGREWKKYIERKLFPIIDSGKNEGLYLTSTFICTDNKVNLIKFNSKIQSLFSLNFEEIEKNSNIIKYLKNLQIPRRYIELYEKKRILIVKSKLWIDNIYQFANIVSSNEVNMLIELSQKYIAEEKKIKIGSFKDYCRRKTNMNKK